MAKIVVVTSGKGGVGKTTTSASFASGLALAGKKTAVIDFDVGLRNLDLIMGCERRVVYDLINVIQGEANLNQALIKDKECDNLFVLAASQTRDKDALTQEGVGKVLKDLAADGFDYIICDSPAGIEKGAFLAMYFADRAVVVVNPEVSSVRDSDRIIGLLDSKTHKAESGQDVPAFLLLTRYTPVRVESGEMLSIADVEEVLGLKAIGVIPESGDVLNASNKGEPVILDGESAAGQAYDDAVARILGLLASKTRKAEEGERVKEHLLLTRYSPSRVEGGEMLSITDVEEVLGLKTIGVIPESGDVLNASNKGEPVILDLESNAGQAYDDAVARLMGQERPMRFTTAEKKGFFSKLFGG